MPQLHEARGIDEDWTGLKDAAARRKLQNRLNVRAHRRRKALDAKLPVTQDAKGASEFLGYSTSYPRGQDARIPVPSKTLSRIWESPFLMQLSQRGTFPLSGDHLIPLVQYNLIRASLTNMSILSLLHTLPEKCHDIWGNLPLFPAPAQIPESLAPTELQMRTPHDVWIDMLPDRTLRDNAILASGTFEWQDMCLDLVGRICEGENSIEMTGMLVWNDPWRPEGWELTDGFVRKWGFLLKGCSRLLDSTNSWRAQRGEEPLVIEI